MRLFSPIFWKSKKHHLQNMKKCFLFASIIFYMKSPEVQIPKLNYHEFIDGVMWYFKPSFHPSVLFCRFFLLGPEPISALIGWGRVHPGWVASLSQGLFNIQTTIAYKSHWDTYNPSLLYARQPENVALIINVLSPEQHISFYVVLYCLPTTITLKYLFMEAKPGAPFGLA